MKPLRTLPVIFLFLSLTLAGLCFSAPEAASSPYFRITVIDQETGRGIPAVKLRMTNSGQYWTDNNGVAAVAEPDLLHQKVWFTAEAHGYVHDASSPEIKGIALDLQPGGSATIPLRRINVAQRLYRMTGSGMYRDSILLGDKVPPIPETGKVPVMGQDGGDMVIFKGQCFWLWGDTSVTRFPLGVFQSVAAVSDLPQNGGLDPDRGVILHYLRKEDGDVRPVLNLKFEGGRADWYARPRVARDKEGQERLLTEYVRVNSAMEPQERGLLEYSKKTGFFELIAKYPDSPVFMGGEGGSTVFRHSVKGKELFYFPGPLPFVRHPADYESQRDITAREAFTCLKEEPGANKTSPRLDRDQQGRLRWGWKKNASPVTHPRMDKMVKDGLMTNEERWYSLYDIGTGKSVIPHQGSVYWNPYRRRWIGIFVQFFGDTLAGEIWYSEADTPQGPWVYAKKILTHKWQDQDYSFYLPAQLPAFDKHGGRTIYFKGSFSAFFGDLKTAAPRHDYNIMVYKLELDDPRLFLPVPVYHDAAKTGRYGVKKDFSRSALDLVWFAPDRPASGTVPVYAVADRHGARLTTKAAMNALPVFFALPPDYKFAAPAETGETDKEKDAGKKSPAGGAPPEKTKIFDFTPIPPVRPVALYEFTHASGKRRYGTDASRRVDGYTRSATPLCLVWPRPILFHPYGGPDMDVW